MIIKKFNGSSWVSQEINTTAQSIFTDSTFATPVFDTNNKLKYDYLPDGVVGGLVFQSTLSEATDLDTLYTSLTSLAYADLDQYNGHYFVATTAVTVTEGTNGQWATDATDDGVSPSSGALTIEAGDWVVVSGSAASTLYFDVINNTIATATSNQYGTVKIGYSTNAAARNYAVQLASGQMYVNVPWADTQRAIHNTPVSGATTTSISSDWAHDHAASQGNGGHIPAAGDPGTFLAADGTFKTPNYTIDTQRAIHDTPVNGADEISISSNWAYDHANAANPHGISLSTFGITATAEEINFVDGVTSNIQTQLGTKAPKASPTFTGTVVLPSTTSIGDVTSDEIGFLEGVTSGIQAQLNGKAASSHTHDLADVTDVTATADEVNTLDGFTGNVDDLNYAKALRATGVTSGEFDFLDGVSSNIQTQLNGKAASVHTHGNITNGGAIGSTAGLMIKTGTGGVLEALAAGSAGEFLTYNGTWATPAGTLYTAGNGISLNGNQFNVAAGEGLTQEASGLKMTYPVYWGDALPTAGVTTNSIGFEF